MEFSFKPPVGHSSIDLKNKEKRNDKVVAILTFRRKIQSQKLQVTQKSSNLFHSKHLEGLSAKGG